MMKKLSLILLVFLLLIPAFLPAQNNVTIATESPVPGNNLVDPDKFSYVFVVGFILLYILFVIIALSRATSVLSKTLEGKYKSKT